MQHGAATSLLACLILLLAAMPGCEARVSVTDAQPTESDEDAERSIREVVTAYHACVRYPDPPGLDPDLFAVDVHAVWTNGKTVEGRAAFLDALADGIAEVPTAFKRLTVEPKIRTLERRGDRAWLYCDTEYMGVLKDGTTPFRRSTRTTLVLEKRGDRWQIVHEHSSRIPK